ncbi:MAG: Amuc_1102 family pilus-like protein [Chthoniobacterales bacterium]
MKLLTITAALLATPLMLSSLHAQGAVNTEFAVLKIEPDLIKTPDYSYSLGPKGKKTAAKDWLEIDVTFGWQPRQKQVIPFVDELTFTYYILLNNKSKEFPQGTLLVGQVTHTAIPVGKDMHSAAFVSPRTLERFFGGKIPGSSSSAVKNIGVTITRQGQMVAANSSGADKKQPWWQNMQQVQGYVLNKNETPFGPLNWDYYEALKASN